MSANIEVLMGEISKNPDNQERDVELLLLNFLKALAEEQQLIKASGSNPVSETL